MSKNLEVLQKVAKIAKIVCRVLFVVLVVSAAITAAAAIITAAGGTGELFKIGSVTVYGMVVDENMPKAQMVILLSAVTAMLIPSAVVMKFAENYFTLELSEGTPFTEKGANSILRLGILTIALPMAGELIAELLVSINASTTNVDPSSGGYVMTGLALILLHFVFKYGAELAAKNNSEAKAAVKEKLSDKAEASEKEKDEKSE